MKVLSLFDGMSCGQLALNRLGEKVSTYYASEVDKFAIAVTQSNFPSTIQLGDIENWRNWDIDWSSIDLVMGGSPCQGFSSSGKQLAFNDPRSRLFFTFVEILNHIKGENPNVRFLLENVKMKAEHLDVISEHLGVEPVEINSSKVSAQNRVRYYWANWDITEPEDKGIKLEDILESTDYKWPGAVRGRRLNKATIVGRRLDERGKRQEYNKEIPITQCLEVRKTNKDKSNCLTTVDKDNVLTPLPPGRYEDVFNNKLPFRYYTLSELCRLQTVPEDYFKDVVSESQARKMLGNGWTVDVIVHILRNMKSL